LKRAILSVLNQTFPAFQVCVYDNASSDDTKLVVSELAKTDSRIKYYRHSENIGAAANFDFGLRKVNTPFFSFLSDDDILLPNFFETAMYSLSANPDAMFYAGLTLMTEDGKVARVAKENGPFGRFSPPDGLMEILNTTGLIWTSIVFRSEVIHRVGFLDAEAGGPLDVDFCLRIAAHHPIIISDVPGAIFTHHDRSLLTATSDFRVMWPGFEYIGNKIMSDESLPLDVRIHAKKKLNETSNYYLSVIGERACIKGEIDNVYEIAALLAQRNNKVRSNMLINLSKLRGLSEPTYYLVDQIRRLFIFCTSLHTIVVGRRKYKQLQNQYGNYLQYLQ
jgi:glycosyltransferase involved in cell wall biosynthesis